jgi:uncharacterized protein
MTKPQLTQEIVLSIASELNLEKNQIENTLKLHLDDCTVPFIARYRKEMTNGLDEIQIRNIFDRFEYISALNERKEGILRSISEQGKLTEELKNKINACKVRSELEDLYLPYKPKKRTRGQIALERGLAPLADQILAQDASLIELDTLFQSYVGKHEELKSAEIVLAGVRDYIAELISEVAEIRSEVRNWTFHNALFVAQVKDEFQDKKTKYNNYYHFSEPVKSIPAHRLMALRRGEKEDILKLNLQFDEQIPLSLISDRIIKISASDAVKKFLSTCVQDSYERLINPSIETEIRLETKTHAEEEAIFVFGKNLRTLLLLPPIPKRIVLGIDPGLRTGSKIVVVDKTGKLLEYTTIFPHHDQDLEYPKNKSAFESILGLIRRHGVSLISIGNGTAGREMESFVEKVLGKNPDLTVRTVMVNEAGASVYSASDIAREEFPDLDITYRGAVSIARRLQDPLAELVKIDPKSIGVGQYQHDVNQSRLKKKLSEIVESCVNYVGVNLNTASPSLLSYIAGIGPSLAKNIVRYRETHGEFKTRQDLLEITGFGPKAFEQSAGFLRIPESSNPLDNTAVHPESYSTIEKMAQDLEIDVKELVGNKEKLAKVKLDTFVSDKIGMLTLNDIIKELFKPGRDPREDGAKHSYNREIRDFNQLQEGQILTGTVTNVTNFGAFVDIGVHQDGLIHISELSNQFIKDVSQTINVGDCVKVKVIALDKERRRISLSKRACEERVSAQQNTPAPKQSQHSQPQHSKPYVERKPHNFISSEKGLLKKQNQQNSDSIHNGSLDKHASLEDLMKKFNSNRV